MAQEDTYGLDASHRQQLNEELPLTSLTSLLHLTTTKASPPTFTSNLQTRTSTSLAPPYTPDIPKNPYPTV